MKNFFDVEGAPSNGTSEVFKQFDEVLSEKLNPDDKERVMTFFRGFQRGTTTAEIKSALVSNLTFYENQSQFLIAILLILFLPQSYLYGTSATSASNIHTGSYFIFVICYLAYCCQLLPF